MKKELPRSAPRKPEPQLRTCDERLVPAGERCAAKEDSRESELALRAQGRDEARPGWGMRGQLRTEPFLNAPLYFRDRFSVRHCILGRRASGSERERRVAIFAKVREIFGRI